MFQTLIFQDLDRFKCKEEVKRWIRKKDKFLIMTSKGKNAISKYRNSYRVRQRNPNKFKTNSLRTITIAKGIKAVVGVLRK